MHPQLEALLDEAEDRYLKPEELSLLSQYVKSLPERLEAYRMIREQELSVMQPVADQLQIEFAQTAQVELERSIKNGLLVLRYCAMAMLLNDEGFLKDRLLSWLSQNMKVYNLAAIDAALYRHLEQNLRKTLDAPKFTLVKPFLQLAQTTLLNHQPTSV